MSQSHIQRLPSGFVFLASLLACRSLTARLLYCTLAVSKWATARSKDMWGCVSEFRLTSHQTQHSPKTPVLPIHVRLRSDLMACKKKSPLSEHMAHDSPLR